MTNEEKKEIGKRIQRRRKELRLTQKELAERVHKVEGSIRQYENGLRMPDETTKVAIANALGVSYIDLFSPPVSDDGTGGSIMTFDSPEDFKKAWNEATQKPEKNGLYQIVVHHGDGITNEAQYRFEAKDLSEREYNVFNSLYSLLRNKDENTPE